MQQAKKEGFFVGPQAAYTSSEQSKIDKKRTLLLTQGVEKLICKLAVPTIISMLVTSFYNLADTYFVGQLNSNAATGAVGVVFSLMAVIQACGFFFGHGSGNYISRVIGKGEYDSAAKMAATGFFSALLVGAVLSAAGLCLQMPLAIALGATDSMLIETVAYMRYILIGAPYMMASLVLNNQLRLQGNSFFSMIGLVSGAIVNIALDPLLIFTFDMGVAGAALATIISQFFSFVLLLIGCQRSSNVSIRLRNFTPTRSYYLEILGGGLPSLGRQGLAAISTALLNHSAGAYGDAVIAAFSVVLRITNFAYSVIIGFGQGFQPVCGFNYGAGKYDRVRKGAFFGVKVATAFMCLAAVTLYLLAPDVVYLFRRDDTVCAIGAAILRRQCFSLPLLGWVSMMNMLLQNIRRVVPASLLAMSRQGIALVPALLVLRGLFGLQGLIWAQPAADLLTALLAVPLSVPTLCELKLS